MSRVDHWRGMIGVGVGLALIGLWGAWVPHRVAALVLSGWDLTEFVKFVPGAFSTRELFYLPVWCAALALALMANQPIYPLPNKISTRLILIFLALGLMGAILPPYPHVFNGYQSAEFRWRFILGFSGALLILLSWFSERWPRHMVGGLLVALALAGMLPPLWQFLEVRGAIGAVYDASLGWGWGLGTFVIGWVIVGAIGGWMWIAPPAEQA